MVNYRHHNGSTAWFALMVYGTASVMVDDYVLMNKATITWPTASRSMQVRPADNTYKSTCRKWETITWKQWKLYDFNLPASRLQPVHVSGGD